MLTVVRKVPRLNRLPLLSDNQDRVELSAPGRTFDGTAGVDVFSARLASAFNHDGGALFSRSKVADSSVWADGEVRYESYLSIDGSNSLRTYKSGTANRLITFYGGTVGNISNQNGVSYANYFSHGLAWDSTNVTHIRANGAEVENAIVTQIAGTPVQMAIGSNNAGTNNFWNGLISHVVLFFTSLSSTQRNRVWTMMDDGSVSAHAILNTVSNQFVLWTLYEGSYTEEWGEDLALNTALYLPFNGDLPYSSNFDGSDISYNGIEPTVTGGEIFRPGKFGKARQVAEETENVATNPTFTDISGWIPAANLDYELLTSDDVAGGRYIELSNDAGTTKTFTTSDQYVTGNNVDWTVSLKYRGSPQRLRIYDYDNASEVAQVYTIAETEWTYITLTGTTSGVGTPTLRPIVYIEDGNTCDIAEFQFEQKSYATPFAYGDMPGCTWSGTPHESASSRPANWLEYPYQVTPGDTIMTWAKLGGDTTNAIFRKNGLSSTSVWIRGVAATTDRVQWRYGDTSWTYIHSEDLRGEFHHYALTYDPVSNLGMLYIDGVMVDARDVGNQFQNDTATGLWITHYNDTGFLTDGLIDDLVVTRETLTPAQIKNYYDSGLPYNPTSYYGLPTELYANFDGTDEDYTGQTPTITGGEIYVDGKYGQARQVAEATENLITNPVFDTGTAGWATSAGNQIIISDEQAYVGSNSCKCIYGGVSDNLLRSLTTTITDTLQYTQCRVWIPSDYDGSDIRLRTFGFSGGTAVYGYADMSKRDQWQLLVTSVDPDAGDLVGSVAMIQAFNTLPSVGAYVYVDAFQNEEKPYATPFAYGDQDGVTWSGTPHASTSVRTAQTIEYSLTQGANGTVSFWVNREQSITGGATADERNRAFFSNSDGTNFLIDNNDRNDSIRFYSAGGAISSVVGDWDNEWHHIAFTYEGTNGTLYFDGVSVGTGTITQPIGTSVYLYRVSPDLYPNGSIDDLAIFNRALTSIEIANIHNGGAYSPAGRYS